MSSTEARKEIAELDRMIDANRAGPKDWAVECDLFRQRGFAQSRRDEALVAERLATARRARFVRAKKCPTCGARTLLTA